MFTILIISLMLAGILLGYTVFSRLRDARPLRVAGALQKTATYILLFVMGAWIGGNEAFWDAIGVIGLQGLLFAVATTGGSVICAYFVWRFFFKRRAK